MALVAYSDGTPKQNFAGEALRVVWFSPSTMDSADTVTPTAITGKTLRVLGAWDHTAGDAITATVSAGTITLDAGGATTNHVYSVDFIYV